MSKTYEEWLEEVGEQQWDDYAPTHNDTLSIVPKQYLTEEMCLAAVKADGLALEYVPEKFKTYGLCLEAVSDSNDILASGHMEVEDGLALKFVPESLVDEKICWEAFCATKRALELIPDQFKNAEMCYLALSYELDFNPIEFIPKSLLPDVVLWACDEGNEYALGKIPRELLTEELCSKVMEQNQDFLEYIPEEMKARYLKSRC